MATWTLYGAPGWGSTLAEAMLTLAGIPFELEKVEFEQGSASWDRLRRINPLGQTPTLVLPDGAVLTESAAIALYLSEVAPQSGLAPPAGDPQRAAFLRRLVWLVAAVYPTFTIADFPARWVEGEAAAASLTARVLAHREALWRQFEADVAPAPWTLGARFSVLDVYVGVMTNWRPGRDWFVRECPRLAAIAQACATLPALAPVFARNFA